MAAFFIILNQHYITYRVCVVVSLGLTGAQAVGFCARWCFTGYAPGRIEASLSTRVLSAVPSVLDHILPIYKRIRIGKTAYVAFE